MKLDSDYHNEETTSDDYINREHEITIDNKIVKKEKKRYKITNTKLLYRCHLMSLFSFNFLNIPKQKQS